jgi:hypothetical protein
MQVTEACRPRTIARIAVQTPLLVPSFSSRGFPDISEIHENMRDYLHGVSLISAYDLYNGGLALAEIYATEVLFIDSGGYEAQATVDPIEPYVDLRPGREWQLTYYQRVLDLLEPLSRVVIVSFDHAAPTPVSEQARQARALFEAYPAFAGDFLCKPESAEAPFISMAAVTAHIDELGSFDIIGITEKELGGSLLERCRNLHGVRDALHGRGHDTPIHIFGCLDPVTVLAYFLCGADVFDGLAWLRFAFVDGVPIYHGARIVAEGRWAESDAETTAVHRIQNLTWLRTQARAMENYSEQHDLAELARLPIWTPHLLNLVRAAGLTV